MLKLRLVIADGRDWSSTCEVCWNVTAHVDSQIAPQRTEVYKC